MGNSNVRSSIIVQPVFITLDPDHDNSKILKEYLAKLDNNFIGLTGENAQIKLLADQFNVYYSPKQFDQNQNIYTLAHSNFVYLISSNGKIIKYYYLCTPK